MSGVVVTVLNRMREAMLLGVAVLACSANSSMERDLLARERAAAASRPPAVAPAPRVEVAGALNTEMVTPYFPGPAEKFAREEYRAAREEFVALQAKAEGEDKARLDLLIAECDARTNRWSEAAKGFARAAEGLPLLADYANYQAARAYFFAQERQKTLAYAEKVNPEGTAGADAALLIGDVLRGGSDQKKVLAHYQGYLDKRPRGIRYDEARYRLAEAHEKLKKYKEAIDIYQSIIVDLPLSGWTKEANERIDALVKRFPKKERAALQALTADEYVRRGMAYFDLQRSEQSEADFARALKAPGVTPDLACTAAYHRAYNYWKLRDRTRSAPLFDEAIQICDTTQNVDLQVKAAYQAGRSYARLGEPDKAIARYEAVEKRFPEHSYADDSRLRQAEQWKELGNEAKETECLASIPEKYPTGDMKTEAAWRLGWRAFKKADYPEAIRWFEKQIELKPIETDWWAEGQPQYWTGRAWAKLGDAKKALASYESVVKLYPLSYYSLLALNRLRESYPNDFARIVGQIVGTPPDPLATFTFKNAEAFQSEGFRRGLEFLRLGLGERALTELQRAGFSPPGDRKEVTDPAQIEKLWAMAFLFDAARRYTQSHWVTRWHVLDYKRGWPEAGNRTRWQIAYPLGYFDLLDRHARKHGYPGELLIAFVREESAFDPNRESTANAHGLTQMIIPTAKRFGKKGGVKATRENLRDPEKNVIVGSNFLAFLMQHFEGYLGLVVAAYNAGEGAVGSWLRERGEGGDIDAFDEDIPYDETRGYTKRVLQSFFVYSYLKDRTIPVMPNTIPKQLIR